MAISTRLATLLREISAEIHEAQKPVRVMRSIDWPYQVEEEFFARGAGALPRPSYQVPPGVSDALTTFQRLAGRLMGDNEIERFLRETCVAMAIAARMILSVGTRDFYHHSVELYGRPADLSSDRCTTHLDLARHFEQVAATGRPPASLDDEITVDATEAALRLGGRFARLFPEYPIKVKLVEHLAGSASSSAAEIRLKSHARFSLRDLRMIEVHEGHIHVLTTVNGRAQPVLAFLGAASPRATRTQEGLAVFAEFVTGSTSLARVQRLCDRTVAIHMAEGGASFLDLYRFFLERGLDEHTAFDCARRVVRGGLVEGGAPFTKDGCYLDGLLRVTNFLRIALSRGQSQLVRLLFVGKLSMDDTPLFDRLAREGLLAEPRYIPRWAKDLSFLTAFMSYTAFLGKSDLAAEQRRLDDRLARAEDDLE